MDTLLTVPAYVLVFALGAAIGSFLSVVVHRIPAGLSIVHPRSRCPVCGHQLTALENLPIIGWVRLKGRCSACRTPIPLRYPLLEAGCGLVFLCIFALHELSWQTVSLWALFSWLLALSLIDLDTMTLPEKLTRSGVVVGLGLQVLIGWSTTQTLTGAIAHGMSGVFGVVLGIWLIDLIGWLGSAVLGKTAMGGGDAKLAALMGAWLGWQLLLLAGFLAALFGSVISGVAIATGRLSRRQAFPFGPFLALGGMIAAVWGSAIVSAYLRLMFPSGN